jgi:hydrogenase maturation protease
MSGAEAPAALRAGRPRILVIGYGNPGRQDDGLGPAVAAEIEALHWPDLDAYDDYQLNIEDALDVAGHDIVWFVDAARTGPAPFAVRDLVPASGIEFTSHRMRPEAVLSIAQRYYDRTPRAFLLAIRGYSFEFVEALSRPAADNLLAALGMLKDRIRIAADGGTP